MALTKDEVLEQLRTAVTAHSPLYPVEVEYLIEHLYVEGWRPPIGEEWRIVGDPGPGYPEYNFNFANPAYIEPNALPIDVEQNARDTFDKLVVSSKEQPWADGPYLEKKFVYESEWKRDGVDA